MAKRRLIQILSAVLCNADVKNFLSAGISRSALKRVCVPGLNCYSCPAAVSSCPLGALQGSLAAGRFPFFVAGFLMLTGVLLGRAVCGFLCPFGALQDLLRKAGKFFKRRLSFLSRPAALKKPRVFLSFADRAARCFKYAVLLVLVVLFPLYGFFSGGAGAPAFCAWLCPAGTLEAGIPLVLVDEALRAAVGFLFAWKTVFAAVCVVWSVFVLRPFCKYICPLGALYALFNRTAIFGVRVDAEKCSHCGKCAAFCGMHAREVNGAECIRCGDCASVCPEQAIYIQGICMHKNHADRGIK